jgi:hypothetical protein
LITTVCNAISIVLDANCRSYMQFCYVHAP